MNEQKIVTIFPFADPNSKYTMMDNFLFDYIMPLVKPNAWKILCLIIRKTRGWHKTSDQISFSQIKAGTGISSDETVNNALKQLTKKGYILAKKGGQWDATVYAINTRFSTTKIEVEEDITTEIEVGPTTKIEVPPTTKIEDTKETSLNKVKDKKLSADADYSYPISLLSEEELKALKLPLSDWQRHLSDERVERKRKGIIKFLESKVAKGALLPDTPEALLLFEKITIECQAAGHRPPTTFPTLATKNKFDKAAAKFSGTLLDAALDKAIHARGKGVAKITDYISSPKWQENNNGQTRAQGTRSGQQSSDGNTTGGFEPGNGRTPEMQAELEAAFAPKPG